MDSKNLKSLSGILNPSINLNEFCKPLFRKFNLNCFSYMKKTLDDNQFYGFSCNPDFNEYYIANCLDQVECVFQLGEALFNQKEKQGHYFLDYFSTEDIIKKTWHNGAAKIFNYYHLNFMVECSTNAIELFTFGTENENQEANNFYTQNIDLLKVFILNFRDKMINESSLNCIYNHPIHVPPNITETSFNYKNCHYQKHCRNEFIKENIIKRMYLSKNCYLTTKEMLCIDSLIKGNSAKASADLLHLTKRTYEAHMANIRSKLNVHNNIQVVSSLREHGVIDALKLICNELSKNVKY